MKMKSEKILQILEEGLTPVEMSFQSDDWRTDIPSKPGWYFIVTNTPLEVLEDVGPPPGGGRHYNIPEKVNTSLSLSEFGACIVPTDNPFYFVYSGEAKNLKARAREHMSGHHKTGCLALENYSQLHKYSWKFHFALCPDIDDLNESKILRTYGEQVWRAKYGWPILCGK
jgi:hypothetical protein